MRALTVGHKTLSVNQSARVGGQAAARPLGVCRSARVGQAAARPLGVCRSARVGQAAARPLGDGRAGQ
jgi:hypothetical protein